MTDHLPPPASMGRRTFVARTIAAIQTAIGATLAFIVGATTLTPSFARRDADLAARGGARFAA